MAKFISIFFVSTLILGLSACIKSNDIENEKEVQVETQNNFNHILYNPFLQQLVKYDDKSGESIVWNDANNQFQYQIPNADNVYIDGNSITNHFKLIEVSGNDSETVYKFKDDEGVFPFALIKNKLYFIHTFYNQDSSEKENERTLAIFNLDTKEVLDFKNTSGLISKGVANDRYIFYTTYKKDNNKYDLSKIEIDNNEINNKADLVKSDLDYGDVYVSNNNVCITDKDYIVCKDKKWDKKVFNEFIGSKLIQVYTSEDSQLALRVTDTTGSEVEFSAENISGFKLQGNTLVVGTASGLQTHKL